MQNKRKPTVAVILGDPAGSSYELCVMSALANKGAYIPIFVGSRDRFEISRKFVRGNEALQIRNLSGRPDAFTENTVYFADIPGHPDVRLGTVTADSGQLTYKSLIKGLELWREGIADAIVLAPISKNSLHTGGYPYESEADIFAEFFDSRAIKTVVTADSIYRTSVVGHCAFRDIVSKLTTDGIVFSARNLLKTMERFLPPQQCRIAVAALNPHAGDAGIFGDEEERVIQPAIDILRADGVDAIGPCPADTVFNRAIKREVAGIVFLYHDQGNIAMKARYFDEAVVIFTNMPAPLVSPGHGPVYGKAGKGTANPSNMILCMDTAVKLGAAQK